MIIDIESINSSPTELCQIMAENGSDKSLGWHNYTLVYSKLLSSIRDSAENVFELGIGTINSGASLKGWKQYFAKANIFGADILHEVLFSEHRIKTFQCDQLNKQSIKSLWGNFKSIEFDFMLEDGLHTFEANVHFFENSIHKLKKDGYYIIEDVLQSEIQTYLNYFENNKINFSSYKVLNLNNPGNNLDNVIIIIKK